MRCMFNLGAQRRDLRLASGTFRTSERGAGGFRIHASHRDACDDQFVSRSQRRRHGRKIQLGQQLLGRIDASDQQQTTDFEISGQRGVRCIAMACERDASGVQCLLWPVQIAGGERNLSFGHGTSRTGHGLFGTEGTRRPAHQRPRFDEISKLRHGDASQCQGRRIFTQGNALQSAEGIARRQRPRGGGDQRIHLGPANTHCVGCVAPPIACSKAQSAALMSTRASFVTQRQAIRGATHDE